MDVVGEDADAEGSPVGGVACFEADGEEDEGEGGVGVARIDAVAQAIDDLADAPDGFARAVAHRLAPVGEEAGVFAHGGGPLAFAAGVEGGGLGVQRGDVAGEAREFLGVGGRLSASVGGGGADGRDEGWVGGRHSSETSAKAGEHVETVERRPDRALKEDARHHRGAAGGPGDVARRGRGARLPDGAGGPVVRRNRLSAVR